MTAFIRNNSVSVAGTHFGADPSSADFLDLFHSPPWTERALCAQTDPDSFFPEKGGSTREAKKICLSCDVRSECLDWALENQERFGIWGGLSERERRKLTRREPEAAA